MCFLPEMEEHDFVFSKVRALRKDLLREVCRAWMSRSNRFRSQKEKKKEFSKEEMIQTLDKGMNELNQVVADLKADLALLKGANLQLKQTFPLLDNTIMNLEDDVIEMKEHKEELLEA